MLQTIGTRLIRCHLYPEHTELSALCVAAEKRKTREHQDEVLLEVKNLGVHFTAKSHFFGPKEIIKAVDGLSFQIKKGKTLALVKQRRVELFCAWSP